MIQQQSGRHNTNDDVYLGTYDRTSTARFSCTTQSDKVRTAEPKVRHAPPVVRAEFERIEQLVAVTEESAAAATAPPQPALFDIIVQLVAVTAEECPAWTAPPY